MPRLGDCVLKGASGTAYSMKVYAGSTRFNDFIPGVFVIAKMKGDDVRALYLGESDNVDPALSKHPRRADFESAGFDRILFLRNADKSTREAVVSDLTTALKPELAD
ncbi:MAG: hypothetical protein KDI19_11655 [Pseudomonadales bacterium]|nr:hypothetical protein [Pseudomonadales bacterium]